MNNLVARIRAVTEASNMAGKLKKDPSQPQYEYDSDEDTEGGTWEHKKRSKEMMATFGMKTGSMCLVISDGDMFVNG